MKDENKSKEQLIKELQVTRRLVDLSPDAIFIQSEGILVFANDAGLALLGAKSAEEIIGKKLLDVLSPTRWADMKYLIEDLLDVKKVPRVEKKFIRLDGSPVDVEVAYIPFEYQGKPALQIVAHDITRRKKVENDLRESEDRFRKLIDNAPLGLIVFEYTGRVTTVNPRVLYILDISTENDIKKINVMDYPPFIEAGISDNIRSCIENRTTVYAQHSYKSKKGNKLWVNFYLTPIEREGKLIAVQALVEDVTESKRYQEEILRKNERLDKELQLANTIQSSLFPVNLPDVSGATLAATAVSANEVGGDYCDLFITHNKKLGLAIGDVMGKGVPAALFVAMIYAFVRNFAFQVDSPSQMANKVNRALFSQLDFSEQFITFFYGMYDPSKHELTYSNAGHNPPIIYRASKGETEVLGVRDFFLGGMQNAQYREGKAVLNPGDIVLFYTDGLKECKNKANEQFGMERITGLLKESAEYDPASIQELIMYEFMSFLDGEPATDDVTMIVIKIGVQQ